MRILQERKNPELEKQYLENEKKTNEVVAYVSLVFVCISIAVQIFLKNDYSSEIMEMKGQVFDPLCIAVVIGFFVARINKYSGAWIKYMLVFNIVLMSVGLFFIYTVYMCYLVLFPLLISARYFDKRFTVEVSLTTFSLFLLACYLNITLDQKVNLIHELHEVLAYNTWEYPREAFSYIVIPISTTFLFASGFILAESNNGYALLKTQAESTKKVASIEAELNMASKIQQSVLPSGKYISPNGNFALGAKEVPAKEVGGDFYDYFMVNDHVLAFLIADVSDKGLPAAMFMMASKKAIQSAIICSHDLDTAAELINKLICQDNKSEMFLTLWLAIIDTNSGIGKYINAGHCTPFIKHKNGKVESIENEPDLFLGNFPDISPSACTFQMREGDTLVLYTDGVTDALNADGEPFGYERLKNILLKDETPETYVRTIINELKEYTEGQEQFDDETVFEILCQGICAEEVVHVDTLSGTEGTTEILNAVDNILHQSQCPEDIRRNICTAVDEICSNISEYAYDGKSGKMSADISLASSYIDILFSDTGTEFNPLNQESPDISGEPLIGGLGIHLVKNIVDDISYVRKDNKNILNIKIIWDL